MTKRSVANPTGKRTRATEDPGKKPRPDYPLYLHRGSNQWSKKVLGKTYYFGTDPVEAEKEWDRVKDDLRAGRVPDDGKAAQPDLTVKWLCDSFMNAKESRFQAGRIRSRETIDDYHKTVKRFAAAVGRLTPLSRIRPRTLEEYSHSLPTTWNVTSKNNHLRMLRSVLKWANESDELERDIKYQRALEFFTETPAEEDLRHDAQLTVEETHTLIRKATDQKQWNLVAALYLGVNCGFTTSDMAKLRKDQVDLTTGWVTMPRPKNGNRRLAKLWPESIAAITAHLATRPNASCAEHEPLVFLTKDGRPVQQDGNKNRAMTAAFRRLKMAAGVHRVGVSQRSTRHLCRTLADGAGDANAARLVMGHRIPGVERRYIDNIDPERVEAICNYIRDRFMEEPKDGKGGAE